MGLEPTTLAMPWRCSPVELQPRMVGTNGIEPSTSAMSKQRSTDELCAYIGGLPPARRLEGSVSRLDQAHQRDQPSLPLGGESHITLDEVVVRDTSRLASEDRSIANTGFLLRPLLPQSISASGPYGGPVGRCPRVLKTYSGSLCPFRGYETNLAYIDAVVF